MKESVGLTTGILPATALFPKTQQVILLSFSLHRFTLLSAAFKSTNLIIFVCDGELKTSIARPDLVQRVKDMEAKIVRNSQQKK